jgi:integrase
MTGKRRGHGEGGISPYSTKAGDRFSIVYRAFDPQRGTQRQFRVRGFTTRQEAQRALRARLREVEDGRHVAPTAITLGGWIETWLVGERSQVRRSTWNSYARNLRTHVAPALGDKRLQHLRPSDFTALYTKLLETGRADHAAGTGLSPRTVQYIHTIVRKCLQTAVDSEGIMQANPCAKARPPRLAAAGNAHASFNYWTAAELQDFLRSTAHQRHHIAWHLLALTGMRRGEALGLMWDAVDLEAGTVSIRRAIVDLDANRDPVWEDPKTAQGNRLIQLDPETVSKLRTQKASQARERLLCGVGYKDLGLVFAMPDGRAIHPDRFSRGFTEKVGRMAIKRIRLHDLRHTWATIALQAGVHPKVVQERLGHSHISITLAIYSHVIPSMHTDAAERVANLVKQQAT